MIITIPMSSFSKRFFGWLKWWFVMDPFMVIFPTKTGPGGFGKRRGNGFDRGRSPLNKDGWIVPMLHKWGPIDLYGQRFWRVTRHIFNVANATRHDLFRNGIYTILYLENGDLRDGLWLVYPHHSCLYLGGETWLCSSWPFFPMKANPIIQSPEANPSSQTGVHGWSLVKSWPEFHREILMFHHVLFQSRSK